MAVGALGALLAFGILILIGSRGVYNLDYAYSIVNGLGLGLRLTLTFVAVVVPVGFLVGFLMGWARTSRSWFVRGLGTTYVEFFRSMPPIVLIFFFALIASLVFRRYLFVENPIGFALGMGVLALALHSGSYQAEIIRAGILSVPTGQTEAAEAIGLGRGQTMLFVTLPQAFRVSLPALGNEFASVIKDTSLINILGALELSLWGQLLTVDALSVDFNLVFIIWVEIALLYFAITFTVTRGIRALENRFKVPGLEAAEL
ncbi:MAG TPA: amino acid ABC transporter permease [Thermoplasmata archaeon]|nr:amino acid ABC transporter permease [Thermoplasmata archaeon]